MTTKGTSAYYAGRTWHFSFRIEEKGEPYTFEGWADSIYCLHIGREKFEAEAPSLTVKLTKGTETIDGKEYKTLSGRAEKSDTAKLKGGRHYRDLAATDTTKDPAWFETKDRKYVVVYSAPATEPCDD